MLKLTRILCYKIHFWYVVKPEATTYTSNMFLLQKRYSLKLCIWYVQTAEVKLHFWDIFDTFLVYLKNTLLVCNTKNIPSNDMNIKNISLATQKRIKKFVWVRLKFSCSLEVRPATEIRISRCLRPGSGTFFKENLLVNISGYNCNSIIVARHVTLPENSKYLTNCQRI